MFRILAITLVFAVAGACPLRAEKALAAELTLSDEDSALLRRSQTLTPQRKAEAQSLFSTGFELWQVGNFAAAELAFKKGLDIDPANASANYYAGDSIKRRDRSAAALYFRRAVAFGGDSADAFKAAAALQETSKVPATLEEMTSGDLERVVLGSWRFKLNAFDWVVSISSSPDGGYRVDRIGESGRPVSFRRDERNVAFVFRIFGIPVGRDVAYEGQLVSADKMMGAYQGYTWTATREK